MTLQSLHMLLCYYHCEIVHSIHQCGTFRLKDKYDLIKREPSMMPILLEVCQPSEIDNDYIVRCVILL